MTSSRKLRSNSCHVNYEKQANCGGVFRQAISKLSKVKALFLIHLKKKTLKFTNSIFREKLQAHEDILRKSLLIVVNR